MERTQDWTNAVTHEEDVVLECDESMNCDFSPDAFGDDATNALADQFIFDGFIT